MQKSSVLFDFLLFCFRFKIRKQQLHLIDYGKCKTSYKVKWKDGAVQCNGEMMAKWRKDEQICKAIETIEDGKEWIV